MTRGGRRPAKLELLAHTAIHLRPSQGMHRARLRAQRTVLRRFPPAAHWLLASPGLGPANGWPASFRPVDARLWRDWPGLASLRDGQIELLGLTRRLAGPDWAGADWEQAGAPALWRFHLCYWDWAWALAADPDQARARAMFAALWRSWHAATAPGRDPAWLPYPAALRAWTWCGLYRSLVAGSDIAEGFLASLAAHASFLRRHLELDVGGNHLIKNLKTLAGLAVFFANERMLAHALDLLSKQLAVQVLPDGGHFERAPAYHCQVLADLADLAGLLRSAGHPPHPELTRATDLMRRWLGAMLSPAGAVPLLNDGFPVDPALIGLLHPVAAPADPLLVFPDTGLARAIAGGWHLLADVGAPCPDELPAHAHADTLGCLVHVDGVPLLVDTGTSSYAPGPARDYERSTAAHNTVEVDGADSTEVWGAFRAARRARVTGLAARTDGGPVVIEAGHDGYRRLPGRPVHHRRWSLTETGLRVDDQVTGAGSHTVTVRWHLAPGAELRLADGSATVRTAAGEFGVAVTGQPAVSLAAERAAVATGFGRTVAAPVLTCRIRAALPVRITTDWRRSGPAAASATAAAPLAAGVGAKRGGGTSRAVGAKRGGGTSRAVGAKRGGGTSRAVGAKRGGGTSRAGAR
jgi:uncharacterized heparinase superfamily protein